MLFLVILKAKNQSVHVYTPAWQDVFFTVAGDVPDGLIPINMDQMNERQLFAHMTVDMLYADM